MQICEHPPFPDKHSFGVSVNIQQILKGYMIYMIPKIYLYKETNVDYQNEKRLPSA